MLDAHLASPITRQRLRSDPVGNYIDGFADWLHQRGYEALTIKRLLGSLAGWNEWLCAAGYSMTEFRVGLAACKVEFENRPKTRGYRGVTSRSLTAASIFIRYIQELGVIRPAEVRLSPADRWPIIGEFRSWTLNHRGLTITTLDVYEFIIAELIEVLGDAPEAYTAAHCAISFWKELDGTERLAPEALSARSALFFDSLQRQVNALRGWHTPFQVSLVGSSHLYLDFFLTRMLNG
jgi:hypothetical protein